MVGEEEFFLKYAFPCAHVLLERGSINEASYNDLELAARGEKVLSRDFIESSFPAAFRRIRGLASEMGFVDYWNMDVIKEYWYNAHNRVIDEGEGNYAFAPEFFCDFCKVHEAEVLKILPQNFVMAGYDGKKRPVTREYIAELEVGDKIRIHHAYAVEKIV